MISDSCNYIYRWTVGAVRDWIMLEYHGRDNLYRFKGVRSWERYLTLSEEDLLVIQAADDGASVLFGVIL